MRKVSGFMTLSLIFHSWSCTLAKHCSLLNSLYILTGETLYIKEPGEEAVVCADGFSGARDIELDKNGNIFIADEIKSTIYRVSADCSDKKVLNDYTLDSWVASPRSLTIKDNGEKGLYLYAAMMHGDPQAKDNRFPELAENRQVYSLVLDKDGNFTGAYGIVNTLEGRKQESITFVEWNEETKTLWGIERSKYIVFWDGSEWDRIENNAFIADMRRVDTKSFEKCGFYSITADDNNRVFSCTDLEEGESCNLSCGSEELLLNPWALSVDDSCNIYSASSGGTNVILFDEANNCGTPSEIASMPMPVFDVVAFTRPDIDESICDNLVAAVCDGRCEVQVEEIFDAPPLPPGAPPLPGNAGTPSTAAAENGNTDTPSAEIENTGAGIPNINGAPLASADNIVIAASNPTIAVPSRQAYFPASANNGHEEVYYITDNALHRLSTQDKSSTECSGNFQNLRDLAVDPTTGDVYVADMTANAIFRVKNCSEASVIAKFNPDNPDVGFKNVFIHHPFSLTYDYINKALYVAMRRPSHEIDSVDLPFTADRLVYKMSLVDGIWDENVQPLITDNFPWITHVRWSDEDKLWGIEDNQFEVYWNGTYWDRQTSNNGDNNKASKLATGYQICGGGEFVNYEDGLFEYCDGEEESLDDNRNCGKVCFDKKRELVNYGTSALSCGLYAVTQVEEDEYRIIFISNEGESDNVPLLSLFSEVYAVQPFTLIAKGNTHQPQPYLSNEGPCEEL